MKKILILSALLITLITISAKAWVPCPTDPTLNCTNWAYFEETKIIDMHEIDLNLLCTVTIVIRGYERECLDQYGRDHKEFYIEDFDFTNQPCLDSWLYENGLLNLFNFSKLINYLAEIKSHDLAEEFFNEDPNHKILAVCAPDCIIGQTVLEITYSYPYCFSVCYASDQGTDHYKYDACSMYKCCVHKNKYCWNNLTSEIQLCDGVTEEFDYGDPPQPCSEFIPNCSPRGPWDTLNWYPLTDHCHYHCN
jgi:hypothetical protein